MKLNFGHGILAGLFAFMTGMSYLVYRCTQQPVGLVSPEYYSQELKYGDHMIKEKNSLMLNEEVDIAFNSDLKQVVIKYPLAGIKNEISGEVLFFKPDNKDYDFTVPVSTDAGNMQHINASKLPAGAWWIKINWKAEGTPYYDEEKIFIN